MGIQHDPACIFHFYGSDIRLCDNQIFDIAYNMRGNIYIQKEINGCMEADKKQIGGKKWIVIL